MKINDTDFEHAAEFETRVREVISKLYQMGCSKESAEQRLASTLDLVWLTSELVEEVGDTTTVH